MMVKINSRILKDEETRTNSTTRNEVLVAYFVDQFIFPDSWNVGEKTSCNLPDIFNNEKSLGFEVVRCEISYVRLDVSKALSRIGFDLNKYNEIVSNDPQNVLTNFSYIHGNIDEFNVRTKDSKHHALVKLTTSNNKITSSGVSGFFHDEDWLDEVYKEEINKKLRKLKKGNYSECKNVSLIILSIFNDLNVDDAKQAQIVFNKIAQESNILFNKIYLITTSGIYMLDTNSVNTIKIFTDDEFSETVRMMEKSLKIDEYKHP